MYSLIPSVGKSVAVAALLVLLVTGCATNQPGATRAGAYPAPVGPPPPDYVETEFPVPVDYEYYPAYQVYYSKYRREYVYLEHGSWVSRSTPPRTVRKQLSSSPSVRLGFHDSPSVHHAEVVEQYPKNWVPTDTGDAKPVGADKSENGGEGHR